MRTVHTQTIPLAFPDGSGRLVRTQVRIRRETVEVWCRDRIVAVHDRDALSAWLDQPNDALTCEEVSWVWSGTQILIYIRAELPAFPLADGVLTDLRERLAADRPRPR